MKWYVTFRYRVWSAFPLMFRTSAGKSTFQKPENIRKCNNRSSQIHWPKSSQIIGFVQEEKEIIDNGEPFTICTLENIRPEDKVSEIMMILGKSGDFS